MLRTTLAALCLTAATAVLAQGGTPVRPPVDPARETGALYTSVASADAIAVATVTDVVLPPEPEAGNGDVATFITPGGGYRSGKAVEPAKITVTLDKALKGVAVAGAKITVNVPVYPRYERNAEGVVEFAGYNLNLAPKDQRIFTLTETVDGFRAYANNTDIRPVTDQPAIEAAIKAIPAAISITAAPKTYAFGAPNAMKFSVKNTGAGSLTVSNINIDGETYSKKLGPAIGFMPTAGPKGEASALPTYQKPLVLAAGETKEISGYLTAMAPASWALFDPSCCLLTPARIRARMYCTIANPAGAGNITFSVATPATATYVGHPMPN